MYVKNKICEFLNPFALPFSAFQPVTVNKATTTAAATATATTTIGDGGRRKEEGRS